MQTWIIEMMNQFGYIGIALLIALENIFPPIPSEVILTFGGFMTTYTSLTVIGVIISATVGSVIGATVLYGVGRIFSIELLGRFLDGKIGKILHLKKDDVFKACEWFNNKGKFTVLFCRCIPVIRSLISIPAGISQMKFSSFIFMTVIGSLIWNIVLVYLGVFAGSSWSKIVDGSDLFTKATVIIIMLISTFACGLFFRKRTKSNKRD